MSRPEVPTPPRLLALDVFRGCAVIAMMLVDWTGSWETRYAIFNHAKWLGLAPPDFIFPSLLFIAGVAIPLSLSRVRGSAALGPTYRRIVRRALLLFALGYLLNLFWDWVPGFKIFADNRLMGVLQRYALVYPVAALLYLKAPTRALVALTVGVLLAYWAVLTLIPVPGFGPPDLTLLGEGTAVTPNLATWIDKIVLGHRSGAYYPHDPEGLLTTFPALVTTLIGVVAGTWLQAIAPLPEKLTRLFAWGVALAAAGYLWGFGFPLSKKLWTSSFVLLTGGWDLLLLASFLWLIDVKQRTRFTTLARDYGSNALAAIMLFTFIDNLLRVIPLGHRPDGTIYGLKDFIHERGFSSFLPGKDAAWVYSVVGILLLGRLFHALARRRIFLRV